MVASPAYVRGVFTIAYVAEQYVFGSTHDPYDILRTIGREEDGHVQVPLRTR